VVFTKTRKSVVAYFIGVIGAPIGVIGAAAQFSSSAVRQ
jgi:hypothetical protein